METKVKNIILREITVFLLVMAIAYVLDILFVLLYEGRPGPALSFWKDPYFYQFWNNSLRENAQIIRFLGYPFYLLGRFAVKGFKILLKEKYNAIKQGDVKVKEVIEELVEEIKLRRKVEEVVYKSDNSWYIVRFENLPNCIIPAEYINAYIASGNEADKKKITDILLP